MGAGFELVAQPMCSNVCFWFYPPSLQKTDAPARNTPEWKKTVHTTAALIKQRMQEKARPPQPLPLACHSH